jgi:hypothetical protein
MRVEHTANLHRTAPVDRYATEDRGSRLGRWLRKILPANEDAGMREALATHCELGTRVRRDQQVAVPAIMGIVRTAQTGDAVR